MPRVAFFGLDLTRCLRELRAAENLGSYAATCALALQKPTEAVELLEGARAVFWSQALNLRSPLNELGSGCAETLKDLFAALETGSHVWGRLSTAQPTWSDADAVRRRRQSAEAERIIEDIRKRPGFDRFLLYQHFTIVAQAAAKGPIVILVANRRLSMAIVIRDTVSRAHPVHLCNLHISSLQGLGRHVKEFNLRGVVVTKDEVEDARGVKTTKSEKIKPGDVTSTLENATNNYKGSANETESTDDLDGAKVLSQIWHPIVKPVIDSLELAVSVIQFQCAC